MLGVAVCSPATRGAQRDHGSTITGIAGANLFEVWAVCAGRSGFGAHGRVPNDNSLRNRSPEAGAAAVAVLRLTLSAVRPSILLSPRGAEHTCLWAGPSGAFQLQQQKTDMSQAQ